MRVRLEPPGPRREREFLGAVRRSRSLHRPWVAPPSTAASYRAYLRRLRAPGHDGYFVVLRSSGVLVGVINLSEIVRGPFRSAYLGYYTKIYRSGDTVWYEGVQEVSVRFAVRVSCSGEPPGRSRVPRSFPCISRGWNTSSRRMDPGQEGSRA